MNWWELIVPFSFFALMWFGLEIEYRHQARRGGIQLKWVRRSLLWRLALLWRFRTGWWRRCAITSEDAAWLQQAMSWHDCPDCAKPLAKHR